MTAATCKSCQHWHKQPLPPDNLTAPATGECRCMLHAVPILHPHSRIPQLMGSLPYYPLTAAEFPACGQFQSSLRLIGSEEVN